MREKTNLINPIYPRGGGGGGRPPLSCIGYISRTFFSFTLKVCQHYFYAHFFTIFFGSHTCTENLGFQISSRFLTHSSWRLYIIHTILDSHAKKLTPIPKIGWDMMIFRNWPISWPRHKKGSISTNYGNWSAIGATWKSSLLQFDPPWGTPKICRKIKKICFWSPCIYTRLIRYLLKRFQQLW